MPHGHVVLPAHPPARPVSAHCSDPPATAMLRAHQDRQRFERQVAGDEWERGPDLVGLVFTNATGAPLHCTSVTHTFQDLLGAAGLPRQRFQ